MHINDLIKQKGFTKYRLAKLSEVPNTTLIDICSGKAKIEKCSGETLYKIAKALDVSIETLIEDAMEYRPGFEFFKSNTCHHLKRMGDIDFIIDTLENDSITHFWNKKWYAESLYLLAMTDYLSRENGLPLCDKYNDIRRAKLKKIIYPAGILTLNALFDDDEPKEKSLKTAIPEFMRHNIVENEVRDVI